MNVLWGMILANSQDNKTNKFDWIVQAPSVNLNIYVPPVHAGVLVGKDCWQPGDPQTMLVGGE